MFSTTIAYNTKEELVSRLQALIAMLGTAAAASVPAAEPKAKPKKEEPKKEPAQESLDLGGGGAATDDLDALLGGGEATPAEPEITEDDMKAELRKVLGEKGKDIVTKILRKHGAMVVGDIKPEERKAVMETCKAVLKK